MFKPDYGSDDFNQTSLNLLRSGTVTDRRNGVNGPEVRVSFPDRDVTSDWLPVGQTGSGGMSTHFCPRKGTNVLVGHLGTGVERGVVLCSNPTQNGGALIPSSINSMAMMADDGAQMEYNPDTGNLHVGGVKTIEFIGGSSVTITLGGPFNVTASDTTITSGTITLNGNVHITGTLIVDQPVTFSQGGNANPHIVNEDGTGGGT